MNSNLNNRLQHVSEYLEQADNSNIILRNTKGKRVSRMMVWYFDLLPKAENQTLN